MNEQYGQPFNGRRNFDTDAWVERQQKERDQVYGMIEQAVLETASDPKRFMEYLDVQARLDRYTVSNAMLIMKQYPTATLLKEKNDWTDERVYVRQSEKPVLILKPKEYVRLDGGFATAYNVRRVYDISQTSFRGTTEKESVDLKLLSTAVVNSALVPVLINKERTSPEQKAVYDHQERTVFVSKDMSNATELFQLLALEMAHVQLAEREENYDRDGNAFRAGCIAYLLCKKNGVDAVCYAVEELPKEWKEMEAKDIRGELSVIKEAFGEVQGRMTDELYRIRREEERAQDRERRQQERQERQKERERDEER